MPTYLRALESTTAANTYACLKEMLDSVPDLQSLASDQDIPLRLTHSCTDRYAANIAAERGLSALYHETELVHMFCDVHKAYSVTKAAMKRVEFDVCGMLAFSLAFSDPGAVSVFQQALARIFSRELVIYYQEPPVLLPGSPEKQCQDELWDLFLPIRNVTPLRAKLNRKRRYVLAYMLNGDWRVSGEVQHFCTYGCCCSYEATMKVLAVFVTWALCPRQCPVFARSRWTRYDESVDYCGLLAGCHGLLHKLLVELTGRTSAADSRSSSASTIANVGR